MSNIYYLKKSNRKDKKYMVKTPKGKTIHFGANGMSDYTIHKDHDRKLRYESRHRKRENWNDPNTAGFWSKNILWNLPSLQESIRKTEREYNIIIRY